MKRAGERKERSDKKREVKPLIPSAAKELIYRISHITHTPVKDVCEFLVVHILRDKSVLGNLATYFKRDIGIDNTFYMGDINAPAISKRVKNAKGLVTIKFKRHDYELISAIAYALDVTPTRATAILLELATYNVKVINEYVRRYMIEELTASQMRELRKVLSYVNRYSDGNNTWLTILSTVVGDIRPATKKLYELVDEYLKK